MYPVHQGGVAMNGHLITELKRELAARGFSPDGSAPNGSMTFDDAYLASVEIAELFDTMVARREKVFRSTDVVGADIARNNFDDVNLAIDAIKAVISRLTFP
jgi:hypothetical protein